MVSAAQEEVLHTNPSTLSGYRWRIFGGASDELIVLFVAAGVVSMYSSIVVTVAACAIATSALPLSYEARRKPAY